MAATLLITPPLPRQFLTAIIRSPPKERAISSFRQRAGRLLRIHAIRQTTTEKETETETETEKETSSSAEDITEKYGLEFGLWKIFRSRGEDKGKKKSRADQAKELLAKYGGAYLATSITLSVVSFSLCYLLVSAGIDVQSLLGKIGIAADETGEKVGTFALAYAAHKAASPIRFPPTVALTPVVAGWIGKKSAENDDK